MTTHTLLLGLDSATWDLLDPWMAEGLLPNLAALRERSAWGVLRSTIMPLTAPAWTTLLTGVNQGKHGIYDFTRRKPASYSLEMTNASMVAAPTIYDYLSAAERRVASMNMPYTFPPRPLNGALVSGLFATVTGPEITYPRELWQEIAAVAPRYTIAPDYDASQPEPLHAYVAAMQDSVAQRALAAEYLLAREPWDLFTLVFTETDEIQHAFWHCLPGQELPSQFAEHPARYGNPILAIYQQIDAALPRLLELAGPDANVYLVSDHGAGALRYLVYVNRLLADAGLLTFRPSVQASGSRLSSLARLYKRSLSNRTRARLRGLLGGGVFERVKAEFESRHFSGTIDWAQTRAYCLGWGNIFVNLAGREPEGIVAPGEQYDQVLHEVTALLRALRHPETNAPLNARVYRRDELYHGPLAAQAPDLVVWGDADYCLRGGFEAHSSAVFERSLTADLSDLPLTGQHRRAGILMASGPAIGDTGPQPDAAIASIAPTLLAGLGLAVPETMDGQVLDVLRVGAPGTAVTPDDWQAEDYKYSAEEQAAIQRRLEDLGYL